MIGRKINRRVAIFLVFTLVISMFGAFPGGYAAAAEAETEILTILHTNDIHASIQDFAKVAHYIATERAQSENFLYLDAGDVFSGDPVVDLPKGKPMIELFNKVGLDAMAIGNHEFDYGPENFNLRMNESHFPWLSANMEVVDSIIEQPEPYTIFEMDDFTVGVISLTQAPPATSPKNVAGVEFHDYNETVEQYLSLRDEVDVLVGLTHIGFAEDQHLAREFDIFDVIIGGHSHTALSQASVVNGTTIVQTGSHLNRVGHLTIEVI